MTIKRQEIMGWMCKPEKKMGRRYINGIEKRIVLTKRLAEMLWGKDNIVRVNLIVKEPL